MNTNLGLRLAVLAASVSVVAAGAQQSAPVAELLRQFQQPLEPTELRELARKIGNRDASVLKELEPWLSEDDRHVRGNVALVFASVGDPRGLDTILSMLTDPSPRVVRDEYFGGNPNLAAQIRSDRYYAVHLLGVLKDPRTLSLLVNLLDDADLSQKAVWAIGEIGDATARQALTDALGHRAPLVRVSAIAAVVKLRVTEALPKLRALLADDAMPFYGDRATVADRARAAIAELTKKL